MKERREWRGQSESQIEGKEKREVAGLLVLPRSAKSVQNGTGFSGET